MLLGAGGSAETVYIDDVFSTYVYKGDGGSARTISNGIDQLGKGAMTWIKNRNSSQDNVLVDSERGPTKRLVSNGTGQESTDSSVVHSFKSTGFRIGNSDKVNNSSYTYSSWSFRKQEGFFDIVTYSGTGSTQSVAHSLGTTPGFIMVKALDSGENWSCYHQGADSSAPEDYNIYLNQDENKKNNQSAWNDTAPSSTHFTVKSDAEVNGNGTNYVAYLFAGSASTASTARSVDFDGNDYLSIPVNNSDFDWAADGSLTIEAWVNMDNITGQTYNSIINRWGGSGTYSFGLDVKNNGNLFFYRGNGSSITTHESSGVTINVGQWYHIAVVKDGTTGRFFINGRGCGTFSWNEAFTNSTSISLNLGNLSDGNSYPIDGRISNARFVNGQALYTTSFRPSTEPLTTTSQSATASNVKLLCCNNSSTTGSTVTPGTISANGDPTASTDNPFLDSAGYTFGGSGDQNIIKCGSYIGNGSSDGPTINLGWEPQWILFKNVTTSSGRDWCIVDSIRGAIAGSGSVRQLRPNENNSEGNATAVSIEPTGFKITDSNAHYNENGETIIYTAIRRPDGYVGKPAEAGTDVFTIDLAGVNSGDPSWVSNFPVDMQFIKDRNGTTYNYFLSSRLTHSRYLTMSTSQAQISNSVYTHDYMDGWGNYSGASNITSWMWKRGAGFDVVCYEGDGVSGRSILHSLNAVPQMIWCKNRETTDIWTNGHFGTNGGTNPWHYRLRGNSSTAQEDYASAWNDTAPTSSHFTVGNHEGVNTSGEDYVAFLFTSISGISKLGYYDGSNSEQTITVGFQPRFLMIRRTDDGNDWMILDTFRGWASGNDAKLRWNETNAQDTDDDFGAPTSTGFTLAGNLGFSNVSGGKFIYYAHA